MRYIFWIFLFSLIVFRFFTTRPHYLDGQKIKISAKVFQEPIKYAGSQQIFLAGLKFYLPAFPEISYGDQITVIGVVQKGKLQNAHLIKIEESKKFLYQFRKALISFYQSVLPEPHSALVGGVTLGSKAFIPYQFWSELRKTGTAHVVVASGMNVTLLTSFLINFWALFLKRKTGLFIALAGIWIYAFLSGFEAPLVRAALMGSITFTAQEFGRLTSAAKALAASALAMLIYNPLWLIDLGFILSFVATASLLLFQKPIEQKFRFWPKPLNFLKGGLTTSLAAQIGVAPILFVTFGQFNILSPVANMLILWTIPLIMIIAGIGGVV